MEIIIIMALVISSFILYWIIKNAINNSEMAKKMKLIEFHLAELRTEIKDANKKEL